MFIGISFKLHFRGLAHFISPYCYCIYKSILLYFKVNPNI